MNDPKPTLDLWRELARKELKGAEPDTLAWDTLEGIKVKPLYTAADTEDLSTLADSEPKKLAVSGKGKLVAPEEISQGHVSRATGRSLFYSTMLRSVLTLMLVNAYLSDLGGSHPFAFWSSIVVGLLICHFFNVSQSYWLGQWAQQYEDHERSSVSVA